MDILGLGPDYSVALLLLIAGAFRWWWWLGICAGFSPDQPTTGYGTRDQ